MDPKCHAGYNQPGDAGAGAGAVTAQPPAYQPYVGPPVQAQPQMPVQPHMQQMQVQAPMHMQPASPHAVVLQQPQPSTTTVVQMGRGPRPPMRPWSSGICSCCEDCSSCLLVAFFTPCYACYLAGRMEESCCVGMPGCVPGGVMALRTKMRIEENIEGSICNDCCATHFCMHCVLCQLSREVDYVRNRDSQQVMQVVINTGY